MAYPETQLVHLPVPSRLSAVQDMGWLLLVILVPLWVNLGGQQPFELPKVVLLRTVVWLLTAVVLAEHIWAGRSPWRALAHNPLLTAVLLLALVLITTTTTAVDWRLSLWGSYERQQGAITHLTYLLLFVLAAQRFQSLPRARPLLAAMVATGGLIALLGLGQAAGWNPLGLASDARSPMYATLGRANFVGAYLAMLVPLTLALFLTSPSRYGRWAWLALLAAELSVIALSMARGAWLATAVALLLFLLVAKPWPWRKMAWVGVGVLAASGPLAVLLSQQPTGSTAARQHIWHGAVQLIGQRPWLGYGADSMGLLFPTVYPPALVYAQGRNFFVDRAHNVLLDWAVVAGLPGLLAFAFLLASFAWVVGTAARRPASPEVGLVLAAVIAAVGGNMAHNLVSFDSTTTAMATWLLMGVGVGLANPLEEAEQAQEASRRPFGRWVACGLLAVAVVAGVWQANGRLLLADMASRTVHQQMAAGQWQPAIASAQQAIAYWPHEPAHYLLLGQAQWGQAAHSPTEMPFWLTQTEQSLRLAAQLRPCEVVLWWQLAQFYAAVSPQWGVDGQRGAEEAFGRAAELAPHQAMLYVDWGRFYLQMGDPATAVPLLHRAVALDASHEQAAVYLQAAEEQLGRR